MCGIMGYIGQKQAVDILMPGLKKLTYRGYDSAGIAVMDEAGKITLCKREGKLEELITAVAKNPIDGVAGIAHTRWATHGEPSQVNAHPHMDEDQKIAIVHNGIIENYALIKQALENEGDHFISQTDTEVVAHLIGKLYVGDMLQTLLEVQKILKGSYALGILCSQEKNRLFCLRKDSPLIVTAGNGAGYFASDLTALLPYSREVVVLEDGEIGVLGEDGFGIYNEYGIYIEKAMQHIDWEHQDTEKEGYAHFMLKEIMEQPEAVRRTLFALFDEDKDFSRYRREIAKVDQLMIVGCGTAYHSGMFGKYAFKKLAGISATAEVASEYRYACTVQEKKECILAVSQSGETADTLAAVRKARKHGAYTIALCNTRGSTLERETGEKNTFYTFAGPEIAVASTKGYLTQATVLLFLAIRLGDVRSHLNGDQMVSWKKRFACLPEKIQNTLLLQEQMSAVAAVYKNIKHIFLIGRGVDYAVCMEAALKLKEVSYLFCEAYPAGEIKHGPIALLEEGSLVIAIITQGETAAKTISNIQEVRARNASVMTVCTSALLKMVAPCSDVTVVIDDDDEWIAPLLSIIPMQLLAYYMAVKRGCDVDQPRNLAKSVTVE